MNIVLVLLHHSLLANPPTPHTHYNLLIVHLYTLYYYYTLIPPLFRTLVHNVHITDLFSVQSPTHPPYSIAWCHLEDAVAAVLAMDSRTWYITCLLVFSSY